ncbi:MAG: TusE/DsrC/DsvC family sulfur relay protein [Proteobacteria bacterium]|nr:TusE/DsrC/DsvC family sulfur relay protein [Pseudomonadota bacterium]
MEIKLDKYGHLQNARDWNKQLARTLADRDGIKLTTQHWHIIQSVRHIYGLTGDTPPMRLLIKLLNEKLDEHIDSRFLYRLFPDNPVRLASKYAGLPKPKHCM